MLGEFGEIWGAFLALLLRPNEHFGDFDLLEQLRVEKGHLFGDFSRFEVQQRRLADDNVLHWVDWRPLSLFENHYLREKANS